MKLDNLYLVETPEGTDLHAQAAGLVPRAMAYALDFLIRLVVFFVVWLASLFAGDAGVGFFLIFFFVLEWIYPVYFEIVKNGQTPGKKSLGLRVVQEDLTPVSLPASVLRNLLRSADILPSFYAIGAGFMLLSNNCQRLGDLAAKTIVIYVDNPEHDASSMLTAKPIAADLVLTDAQRAAFVRFALSAKQLSPQRQQEIAEIVRDKIPSRYTNVVDYVAGVGKWIMGAK